MKKFITLALLLICVTGFAQSVQWRNLNPNQLGSNNFTLSITTNAPLTNAVLKIINSATGRGILGERNLESLLWSTTTNGVSTTRLLMAVTPDGLIVYSNAFFQGKIATFSGVGVWTNGVASTGVSNNPNGTISASGLVRAGSLITSGQATISGGGLDVGSLNQFEFLSAPAALTTSLAISKADGTAFLFLDETLNSLTLQSGAFVGNGSGLTNLNYARLTNVPLALSNVVNLASNSYVGTFTGNALNATNYSGTNLLAPADLAWASGSLAVGWPRLNYTHSITSNSWVTGFSGLISGKSLSTFLLVTNAGGSDFTLSVSNSVLSIDGLRSWTVTNKSARGFSFLVGTMTNAASQPFY